MTTKTVTEFTTVHAVRLVGCGHVTFLSAEHIKERRRDHKRFYCSTCGGNNYYPGESDVEALERQLNHSNDLKETYKYQRDSTRRSLTAHKGHTTRIKKRISAGVCPCCNRTFQNLARHMENKHKDYGTSDKNKV